MFKDNCDRCGILKVSDYQQRVEGKPLYCVTCIAAFNPCVFCQAIDHERVETAHGTIQVCPRQPHKMAFMNADDATLERDALVRPPREDYVRASVRLGDFVLELGVEYRDGDGDGFVRRDLRNCAVAIFGADDAMKATHDTSANIVRRWPDRAYFVEIWQGESEGLTQSYQPYGRPRNR